MIRCIKFRPFAKITLKAFVDLEFSPIGLILHDCTLHSKDGQEWIGFPARSFEGNDGTKRWMLLVEFAPGARREREEFQRQALEAIRAFAGQTAA